MRGIEPRPRRWKRRILTTRPHGMTDQGFIPLPCFSHSSFPGHNGVKKRKKNQGPTEIRTRITGFRVLGANHYTMGPCCFTMQQDPACLFSKSPSLSLKIELKTVIISVAVVAEWLRRLTRNQLRSPCTGSNPVNCAIFFIRFFCLTSLGKSWFERKKVATPGGTRTHNPWLRRPMPYPLGHGGRDRGE